MVHFFEQFQIVYHKQKNNSLNCRNNFISVYSFDYLFSNLLNYLQMLHNNIDNNIFFIKKNVVINILRFFWKSKMHHEHDTNTIIKITNIKKSQTCYKNKEKKEIMSAF